MGIIYLPDIMIPFDRFRESAPLFYLAGPTCGGDWQAEMADEIFFQVPHAMIACACRWDNSHRLVKHFHTPFSGADNRKLVWERHYLKEAGLIPDVPGCIIFWLGAENQESIHPGRRELEEFTTYLESLLDFPEMKERLDTRIVVGGDKNFHGLDVILNELENATGHRVPFDTDMHNLVRRAFQVAFR